MFEKCNPAHPDKIADRIAGAIVDLAYKKELYPRVAVEVLIGHGTCHVIAEVSRPISVDAIQKAVRRIAGENINLDYKEVMQDPHLADNQKDGFRCGDNGIFKGVPVTDEEWTLAEIARAIYHNNPHDGKYIIDGKRLIICQSHTDKKIKIDGYDVTMNPLGPWTGGTDVDTGATNRKLGSDMAQSVTGGGIHGKDLSKADVSVNIYAWMLAQQTGKPVELCCAIGDETVGGVPYKDIVEEAREYILNIGGFEKFAEWGLV